MTSKDDTRTGREGAVSSSTAENIEDGEASAVLEDGGRDLDHRLAGQADSMHRAVGLGRHRGIEAYGSMLVTLRRCLVDPIVKTY